MSQKNLIISYLNERLGSLAVLGSVEVLVQFAFPGNQISPAELAVGVVGQGAAGQPGAEVRVAEPRTAEPLHIARLSFGLDEVIQRSVILPLLRIKSIQVTRIFNIFCKMCELDTIKY